MNKRWKLEKMAGFILFAAVLFVSWLFYQCKNRNEAAETQKYDRVTATVNRIYESGRGYRRSTLINVSYTYNNVQRKTTIRRNGYREGVYNAGDTLVIYINPDNPEEIK
jgi:outer membrane lipoprotein-sorting protein